MKVNYSVARRGLSFFLGPTNSENFINYIKEPYSIWENQFECIFIHVPKVAGKSLTKSLLGAPNGTGHSKMRYYERCPSKFNTYKKVAFVRNPWDRLVSAYFYMKNFDYDSNDRRFFDRVIGQDSEFHDFVLRLEDESYCKKVLVWQHFTPQIDFLEDSLGRVNLDFVGRYENIENDYDYVRQLINPEAEGLKRINSSTHRDYREYYDKTTAEIVGALYKRDCLEFGYSFE